MSFYGTLWEWLKLLLTAETGSFFFFFKSIILYNVMLVSAIQ